MHIAIIMDGNGRWAQRRGLPRAAGHREGAKAVRSVVEAACRAGIDTLTLYAFSSDNWERPRAEVDALMALFRRYLSSEAQRCRDQSIRVNIIGRRDRLAPRLLRAIEATETLTAHCDGMILRIAIDCSARFRILAAARSAGLPWIDFADFKTLLDAVDYSVPNTGDVDLVIRTGGEQRLSDFLLWECAYSELYFSERFWPDFTAVDFQNALAEFQRRERRFGRIPAQEAQA